MHRILGRATLAALILAALLAPFPALAALDAVPPGLEGDDDGDPTAQALATPVPVAAVTASTPRLHAPVGSARIRAAVPRPALDPSFDDEFSPRSPPRGESPLPSSISAFSSEGSPP